MSWIDLDFQILKIFNHPSSTDANIYIVTAIFAVYAFLIVLVYHYFKKNNTAKFAHIVISSIVGYILVMIIKDIVGRPRPYTDSSVDAVITKPYDPYSFPSGHSFVAFLLLNFIPPTWPKIVRYLSAVYIVFVPIGSMYIGVHFPSDVFFGSLLGYIFPRILSEKISLKIFNRLLRLKLR